MNGTLGALVIADGGIAGLLACAAAADARLLPSDNQTSSRVGIWVPAIDHVTYARRVSAASVQAGLYGFRTELVTNERIAGAPPALCSDDENLTRVLLDAAFLARSFGATTVLWPVSAGPEGPAGPDLERVAAIVDRAMLIGQLVSVGSETPIEIRAPYADITDAGLADLILDLNLPIWTCWWAQAGADPAAAAEHEYWTGLLRAAGWSGEWPGPVDPPVVTTPPRSRSGSFQEKSA